MPTMCDSIDCPKCGAVEGLYVEDRYGQGRGDCSECGYFFEKAYGYRREGKITKTAETRGKPVLLESWFMLPSDMSGCHIEYTYDSRMPCPEKLQPSGIYLAAKQGRMGEVQEAVAADAGLLHRPEEQYGLTLLHTAVMGDRVELAKRLLDRGAHCETRDCDGQTPLHLAAALGYIDSAMLLMGRAEADLETRDGSGNTPLLLATRSDNQHVTFALLAAGADHGASNAEGWTPLRLAREQNEHSASRVVDFLLAAQELALHLAVRHRNTAKLREELLVRPESVRDRDADNWTPLHQAAWPRAPLCMPGREGDVVKALLEAGAEVEATEALGRTPLHLACRDENPLTIELLLSHGADPGAQDHLGRTPLHYAAELWAGTRFWSEEVHTIVSTLLNHGAQGNAVDHSGDTPLHLAANGGTLMAAHTLLTHGADPYVRNADGRSPIDLAIEKELTLTLAVLRGEEHPPRRGPVDDDDEDWLCEDMANTDEVREVLAEIDRFLSKETEEEGT